MENFIAYILAFGWLPLFLAGLFGLFLGWLLFRGKVQLGDLSAEGEGQLRAEADGLRGRIGELEASASAAANLQTDGGEGDDDESYALEWRNRYLAARVKYLEGQISDKPKKKAAPKKRVVKKRIVKKKVVAKKAPAKKVVAKKPAAKKKKVAKNPNDKYLTWVRVHDPKASAAVVDNIVKYCGISLRSRDASFVSCTDEKELNTVAKGFCTKKLGMKTGQKELVANVCEQMKNTRMKSRVTFYYLCAKSARKMTVFK